MILIKFKVLCLQYIIVYTDTMAQSPKASQGGVSLPSKLRPVPEEPKIPQAD